MNSTRRKQATCPVQRHSLLLAFCMVFVGCVSGSVEVLPENGSVQEGLFEAQVLWTENLDPDSLQVSLNNEDVTSSFEKAEGSASRTMDVLPGKKLLHAQLKDETGIPLTATSLFVATSDSPRESFPGGLMSFACESGFLNSPIQIPGVDLDAGLLEELGGLLAVSGFFPAGDASFPQTPALPFLFGLFPEEVTFDAHEEIPNGISMSPVEMSLTLVQNPEDPEQEGNVCEFSFVMEGTLLPAQGEPEPGDVRGAMIQSLKQVSLSVVDGGACVPLFELPPEMELITFNYLAR